MKPYQQRLVTEKTELDERMSKLGAFVGSDLFLALSADECADLRRQIGVMQEYSDILARRIARWDV